MTTNGKMSVMICPVCGNGEFVSKGDGTYKCRACGALLRDEVLAGQILNDIQVVFGFLSAGNFSAAEEICRGKLALAPNNAELHWLMFLAKNQISFVVDPQTHERKPVFYSKLVFTRDCVLDDPDFRAALHGDNAEQYRRMGQKIEEIRQELCDEIAKNPDFEQVDVFISFKDKVEVTEAGGVTRKVATEDRTIADQVYAALTKLGYKVFFSPVSIGEGNMAGEKYEPKIFAALAGCKAMVLVGTRTEYIESTWVRNEWSRYLFFMNNCSRDGKLSIGKAPDTLFYMYGNTLPKNLPEKIANIEGIPCGISNPDYIQQLCDKLQQKVTLSAFKGRKVVAPVKVGGKKTIEGSVTKRTVATAETTALTLDDDRKLKAAENALDAGDFQTAEKYASAVLLGKPHNSSALLVKLMAKCQAKSPDKFYNNRMLTDDYQLLCDNILYGEPNTTKFLVDLLKARMVKAVNTHDYASATHWLKLIVNNEFEGRRQMFIEVLEAAKAENKYVSMLALPYATMCKVLLSCFDADDVQDYIAACKTFAERLNSVGVFNSAKEFYAKAIQADPDDPELRWLLLRCSSRYIMLGNDARSDLTVFTPEALEEILARCQTEADKFDYVARVVDIVLDDVTRAVDERSEWTLQSGKYRKQQQQVYVNQIAIAVKTLDGAVQYVDKQNDEWLASKLNTFADELKRGEQFDRAETYYKRALDLGYTNAEVYWGLLQAKLKCVNESRLNDVDTPIDEVDGGNLYANVLAAAGSGGAGGKYVRAKQRQAEEIRLRKERAKADARNRKKKTILFTVIAVAVLLALVAVAVLGWYVSQSKLQYTAVEGGFAVAAGRFYDPLDEFAIPSEHDGKPVVSILPNGFAGKHMQRVYLPDTLKYIGASAFEDCASLVEIYIPSGVESVDMRAFAGCAAITEIQLPTAVVGDKAFEGCTSLTVVTVENYAEDFSIKQYSAFWALPDSATIRLVGVLIVGDKEYTFELGASFTLPVVDKEGYTFAGYFDSETDGNAVTDSKGNSLAPFDFTERKTLYARLQANVNKLIFDPNGGTGDMDQMDVATDETVKLPACEYTYDGCTFVGWSTSSDSDRVVYADQADFTMSAAPETTLYAVWKSNFKMTAIDGGYRVDGFADGCETSNVVIPATFNGKPVTKIGESAFRYCYNIVSVSLPSTLTNIGSDAFELCYRLKEVINKSVLTITAGSKDNSGIAEYALAVHDGETKIVRQGDYRFITIDGTNYLIDYDGKESEITLPTNYNGNDYKIASYAFDYSTSIFGKTDLKKVTALGQITEVGYCAFADCDYLSEIILSDNVTKIDSFAFGSCTKLTSFTVPANLQEIGTHAFFGCYRLVEVINKNTNLTVVVGDSSNGCLGEYALVVHKNDTSRIKRILDYKFIGVNGKNYLVDYVGDNVDISLPVNTSYATGGDQRVLFPSSGDSDCDFDAPTKDPDVNEDDPTLDSNYLPIYESNGVFLGVGFDYEIHKYAFYSCNIKSVTISDGVTAIGDNAFKNCTSLSKLVVKHGNPVGFVWGSYLESIGASAFANTKLQQIDFNGSVNYWNNTVTKGAGWIDSTATVTVHCTDGDVTENEILYSQNNKGELQEDNPGFDRD